MSDLSIIQPGQRESAGLEATTALAVNLQEACHTSPCCTTEQALALAMTLGTWLAYLPPDKAHAMLRQAGECELSARAELAAEIAADWQLRVAQP